MQESSRLPGAIYGYTDTKCAYKGAQPISHQPVARGMLISARSTIDPHPALQNYSSLLPPAPIIITRLRSFLFSDASTLDLFFFLFGCMRVRDKFDETAVARPIIAGCRCGCKNMNQGRSTLYFRGLNRFYGFESIYKHDVKIVVKSYSKNFNC